MKELNNIISIFDVAKPELLQETSTAQATEYNQRIKLGSNLKISDVKNPIPKSENINEVRNTAETIDEQKKQHAKNNRNFTGENIFFGSYSPNKEANNFLFNARNNKPKNYEE